MQRALYALATLLAAPTVWSGNADQDPVAYYSPDITRDVSGFPIFPSDAHRENETGVTMARPAGLPLLLTQLRGANLDAIALQNGRLVFSLDVGINIDGSPYVPGDVVRCNSPSCSTRTLLLNGEIDLPRNVNVDAVAFARDNGDLLYSIDVDASYGGDLYFASDVIRWNGSTHVLEFDGRRLPTGVNLDAVETDAGRMLLSTDIGTTIPGGASPTLLVENQDVVAFNTNTQVFTFGGIGPSGDWSTANLDALYLGTVAETDRIFADGFEAL